MGHVSKIPRMMSIFDTSDDVNSSLAAMAYSELEIALTLNQDPTSEVSCVITAQTDSLLYTDLAERPFS